MHTTCVQQNMLRLLIEALDKLQKNHNRLLIDAVGDCAVTFESMSDSGTDSMYSEPSRKWRHIEPKLKTAKENNESISTALTNDEIEWVVTAYLWCSINNETTCFTAKKRT